MALTSSFYTRVAVAILCISAACAQTRDLQAVSAVSQTSISWNASITGSDPLGKLQFNDSRLANTAGGLNPSQVCFVIDSLAQCARASHHSCCLKPKFPKSFLCKYYWTQMHLVPKAISAEGASLVAGPFDIHRIHKCDNLLGNWRRHCHCCTSCQLLI